MSDEAVVWNPLDVLKDNLPDLDPNTVTAALVIVEYFDPVNGEITWQWSRNTDVPATRHLGMMRAVQVELEGHYARSEFDADGGDDA